MRRFLQCACLPLALLAGFFPGVAVAESVFEDMSFRQGFLLSYPDVSQGRAVEAMLDLGRP